MMNYRTIQTTKVEHTLKIILHRPEKKHAMNLEMIHELTEVFQQCYGLDDIHLIELEGSGHFFCAGADLSWVAEMQVADTGRIQQNFTDLHQMLVSMYRVPQLIIAKVKGGAFGGGLGLLACADFVVSDQNARFAFSEINLGLIPATISPFVVAKTSAERVKKYFFSGELFNATQAKEMLLVSEVVDVSVLDSFFGDYVARLREKSPAALKTMKQLFRTIQPEPVNVNIEKNTRLIAGLIQTDETQQSIKRFLEKRKQP